MTTAIVWSNLPPSSLRRSRPNQIVIIGRELGMKVGIAMTRIFWMSSEDVYVKYIIRVCWVKCMMIWKPSRVVVFELMLYSRCLQVNDNYDSLLLPAWGDHDPIICDHCDHVIIALVERWGWKWGLQWRRFSTEVKVYFYVKWGESIISIIKRWWWKWGLQWGASFLLRWK